MYCELITGGQVCYLRLPWCALHCIVKRSCIAYVGHRITDYVPYEDELHMTVENETRRWRVYAASVCRYFCIRQTAARSAINSTDASYQQLSRSFSHYKPIIINCELLFLLRTENAWNQVLVSVIDFFFQKFLDIIEVFNFVSRVASLVVGLYDVVYSNVGHLHVMDF